ncbi:MAG: Hsp20/alpha crystallin family protein [bacterium]
MDQSGRWDPLRLLGEEMGRMMERLGALSMRTVRPFPSINVYERGHAYIVLAEVAGVDPDSIDVSVAGDTVTICGTRLRDARISDEMYRRQERPFGRWERSVTLPESVLAEDVTAELDQGVLYVELPKADRPRPQQIPVRTKKSGVAPQSRRPALESGGFSSRPALPGIEKDPDISKPSSEGQP